jgi:hypothetical protein
MSQKRRLLLLLVWGKQAIFQKSLFLSNRLFWIKPSDEKFVENLKKLKISKKLKG